MKAELQEASVEMKKSVYSREPLRVQDGIPVFTAANEYTDNYETISFDHLSSMEKNGTNPFIAEKLWQEMERSTVSLVEKYSRPGDSVLDVGVGLGRVLAHFPQLQRYGMDISFGYLKETQSKGIEVCYAQVEEMPYRPESFDLVLATDILEHVLDLNLCCAKMLSVLKPGGVLIARVPYREDLSGYLAPENPYKYVHVRNFDEGSLRLLFERIFDCEWVEATKVAHHAYGGNRLVYRLPRADQPMRRALERLETSFPNAYRKLSLKLVLPMEINVVVRKK
ncbi:MAG TPA: class I SAM-dependent methyltransferase [Pyrinomonadaceae bacterium]|nr:class I SAM-dependent methyltransferase [Pyrinomonadaceae bacterium]